MSTASLAFFVATTIVGALGTLVGVQGLRFEGRVAREVAAMLAAPPSPAPRPQGVELPAPVARYRELAVGTRAPVRTVRLKHRGTFRMSATADERPIDGTQIFTADPPGFVWTGRVRMGPGVWVDARDTSVGGTGSMRVLLDDTVTLADAEGPPIDQGAALRLLAELVWYPTAFFDARTITWSPVDARHATATLRVGAVEVTATFEFGRDGLPSRVSAARFADDGALQPWSGTYGDWHDVSGLRVPFEAEVSWDLPTGRFTYARWRVDEITYDEGLPVEDQAVTASGS